MANPVIRGLPVYINGKKAATVNKWSLKFKNNREPMFGADGLLTHTKGASSFELQVTEITPIIGSSLTDINKKLLNQEDIQIGVPIGQQLVTCTCAGTGHGFESDSESGKVTGEATFSGGVPTVQG